jgi:integral membrane protein (TIGR00529 family)
MLSVIGVIVAFFLIVALRLRNVDFSVSILAGSVIISLTSGQLLGVLFRAGAIMVTDPVERTSTLNICAAVALITVLGYGLKETGLMSELIEGLRSVLPSRVLLALIPATFGLLSMPGGALMSAPFNEPEADRLGLRPEHKTYINVWFRHLWYWASPISPVPILAASLAGISLNDFLAVQLPMFAVTLALGFAVSMYFIRDDGNSGRGAKGVSDAVKGLAPIIVTILLSAVGVPVWAALIVGVSMVYAVGRVPASAAFRMARDGVRWDIVASVVSMLFFRHVVAVSGSVDALFEAVLGLGVPLMAILVIPPILVGTISGTPTMGIGIVFPLLLPLIGAGGAHLISIAYAGVIAGYLASPMHLCLVLTNSYYKSELGRVYRYLVPSVVLLYLSNLLYHLAAGGALTL